MNTRAFVLFASAVSLSSTCYAESLRCNGDLVELGDAKFSVIQKCGDPIFVDTFCKPPEQAIAPQTSFGATTINIVPCLQIDEWSYNPGPGQFITILRFEAGVLTSIKYGDRVK
jgi:Protein of unknown function (DUF2845)